MRDLPSRNTSSSKRQRETKVEQRYERGQGFGQMQPQQKEHSGKSRPPVPPPKPNFQGLSQELGIGSSQGLVIQPKLMIGAPNDKYEQEADLVAAQVMQRLNTPKVEQGQSAQAIQRETLPDKDEKLQVKPDAVQRTALLEKEVQAKLAPVARSLTAYPRVCDLQMKSLPVLVQEAIDDEADLQMKPTRSRGVVAGDASADLESAINSSRGSGQPLDLGLQQQMGRAMGVDFRGVKIHTNDRADSLNRALQSRAFTTKQDIFFKQGEYNPLNRQGQELIAHELTHVVQQNGSTVQPRADSTREDKGWFQQAANQSQPIQIGNESRELPYKGIYPKMRSEHKLMRKIMYEGVEYDSKGTTAFFSKLREKGNAAKGEGAEMLTKLLKDDQVYEFGDIQHFTMQSPQVQSPTLERNAITLPSPQVQSLTKERQEEKAKSGELPTIGRTATSGEKLTLGRQNAITATRRIIKFNFAGSGEETWKTRKNKYMKKKEKDKQKPITKAMGDEKHQSGGLKYVSHKESLGGRITVVEYGGPKNLIIGGISDSGKNSTTANLGDAKKALSRYVGRYIRNHHTRERSTPRDKIPHCAVNIKGFSRGAATASVFAHWIKSEFTYRDFVDVNLVLIDPVHGTKMYGVGQGLMPEEQDVSNVYDPNAVVATGATLVLPAKSRHDAWYERGGFNPQHVRGYQRIVIEYGEGVKHTWGMGESKESTLKYQDKDEKESRKIKGMKFSTLPPGLFVVSSSDMQIKQVYSYREWQSKYKDEIEKSLPEDEPARLAMIQEAVKKFLPEQLEESHEARQNRYRKRGPKNR